MAGKICPNKECGQRTFFLTHGLNRECSKCGFKMKVPVKNGKGGKGHKCANCNKHTVFNRKCNNKDCGAVYE